MWYIWEFTVYIYIHIYIYFSTYKHLGIVLFFPSLAPHSNLLSYKNWSDVHSIVYMIYLWRQSISFMVWFYETYSNCPPFFYFNHTVCRSSSDRFYVVTYYIKWFTTSLTYSVFWLKGRQNCFVFKYIQSVYFHLFENRQSAIQF